MLPPPTLAAAAAPSSPRRDSPPPPRRSSCAAAMSSNASTYSNPFVGPDPADIRDINIHERVPDVLDATDSTYFAWKMYFSLLFRENNLVDHVDNTIDSRVMVGDSE